jgi:hypothetical protein
MQISLNTSSCYIHGNLKGSFLCVFQYWLLEEILDLTGMMGVHEMGNLSYQFTIQMLYPFYWNCTLAINLDHYCP